MKEDKCCCGSGVRLVFACSGGADVGALPDLGIEKGSAAISEENITKVAEAAKRRLAPQAA